MRHRLSPMAGVWLGILLAGVQASGAAELKVLTAGAFKQGVLAVVPEFEKQTGHKVEVDNDTVGGLTKKIEGGAQFDVVVLTPAAVDDLTRRGDLDLRHFGLLARDRRRGGVRCDVRRVDRVPGGDAARRAPPRGGAARAAGRGAPCGRA